MKAAVLTLRFACELALVAAVVWWGWPVYGIVFGAAVVAVWGLLIAPKAKNRLPDPGRLAVELALFAGATVGLLSIGRTVLAVIFAAASVGTALATRTFDEMTF